jgi:hypothetical protein
MYVYRSSCSLFIIIFSDKHARDEVYAAGRIFEEAIELRFFAWELDEFAEKSIIPYHVKLSMEGIPHHAWSQEIADKILCDEAIIHHVEEDTRKKIDFHTSQCWAFSKDPSRIPQTVFLTLVNKEIDCFRGSQVHFVRLRGVRKAHVFKILIHINVVEDLLFYHHPHEERMVDGKIPWRKFKWQLGHPNGDLIDEEDRLVPPTRLCDSGPEVRWHRRYDEDGDRDHKRPWPQSIMRCVSDWMDSRGKSRNRHAEDHRGSGCYQGESSLGKSKPADAFPHMSFQTCFSQLGSSMEGITLSK